MKEKISIQSMTPHFTRSAGIPDRQHKLMRPRLTGLDILFWFVMFTVNLQNVFLLWGIETIYKPYRVASLVLAVLALPRFFQRWRLAGYWVFPILFAVAYGVLVTLAASGANGLIQVTPLIATAVALLVCTFSLSGRRSAMIGCYFYLAGYVLSCFLGILFPGDGGRFTGLFHNPNYFGFASCIAIIFLMNPALRMPTAIRISIVASALLFVVLSGSRSSIVAALIAGGSQIINNPRLFAGMILLGIAGAISAIVFEGDVGRFQKANTALTYRFSTAEIQRGGAGRLAIANAGVTVGLRTGFVGIGIDQFRIRYFREFFPRHARDRKGAGLGLHNGYVSLLAEWGLPAFVAITIALWRIFNDAKKDIRSRVWIRGYIWVILVIALAGVVFETPHFWLIGGFCIQLLSLHRIEEMRRRQMGHQWAIQGS